MGNKTKPVIVPMMFFTAMTICAWSGPSYSADQLPPGGSESPPGNNPETRPKTPPPDLPPPSRDPGIVKQPETVPHPDSVVVPPVVDPGMAVNPEQPQGTKPNRPPARDNPQHDPAPRR